MKTVIKSIVIVIASVCVFNASAANKMGSSLAANAQAKAHASAASAQLNNLSQTSKSSYNADVHAAMNKAATQMGQSIAQVNVTAQAVAKAQVQANRKAAVAAVNAPTAISAPTANTNPAATGSIHVAAGSLAPNTPVNTPAGTVPAASLPADTQVAVPHVEAIIGSPNLKGGQDGHNNSGHSEHGTGSGQGNAASHSNGLGGGSHIGGGSNQNGGFHGNW